MIYYHPGDIVRQAKASDSDMTADNAAFGLDEGFCLVFVRMHFSAGTGTADCTLSLLNQDDPDETLNSYLYIFSGAGTGTDGHFSPLQEATSIGPWSFAAKQKLAFLWTNPDDGTMRWGIEVGLIPWSKIYGTPV